MQNSVKDVFKHNRARKNVIFGGAVILICITALSCISSFMIYRGGFGDMPFIFQQALALFAVIVVEGAFVWLVSATVANSRRIWTSIGKQTHWENATAVEGGKPE